MNKINTSTKIGFLIIEAGYFYVWLQGYPAWYLLVAPLSYVLLYLIIKIFIWDAGKQVELRLSYPAFRINDIVTASRSGTEAIVLGARKFSNNETIYDVFPIKRYKSRLMRQLNLVFIKTGYRLRSIRLYPCR